MLNDLTISADPSYSLRREFNLRTNCVTSMFLQHLGQYDAGRFRKIVVAATEGPVRPLERMDAVVRVHRAFDFDAFWRAGARKETLARFLHGGLLDLAARFGWGTDPFDRALTEMAALEFHHVVDWRRPVLASHRRRMAQVRYYYEDDKVRLVAVIRTREGAEIGEIELARTPPHELMFVPLLGKLRWAGNDIVVLEPKDQGQSAIVRRVP